MSTRKVLATLCVVALSLLIVTGAFAGPSGEAASSSGDEVITITWVQDDRPIQPVRPDSTTIDEIERLTNVRVQMEGIPASDYAQVAQVMVATDDMPDWMRLPNYNLVRDFYDTGVILPISDHFDAMPDLARLVEGESETRKVFLEGTLYHLPYIWRNNFRNGQLPLMRTDILEGIGEENPTTFEELFDVLAAMKAAYPESFPYTARGLDGAMRLSYSLSVPIKLDYDPAIDGGKWIYGSARPEFRATLEWLHRAYQEGILDPDFASLNTATWQERLGSGRSFFYYDNASFSANMNNVIQRAEGIEDAYEYIPIMANDNGRRRDRLYNKHHLAAGSIVSADIENQGRVLEFLNWLYTDEGSDVTNFGIRDVDYTVDDNGRYWVADHHVEARAGDSDPWRSHMSYMASGLLMLGHWVDQSNIYSFIPEATTNMWLSIESDPALDERIYQPPLTPEEIRVATPLRSRLDTIHDEWTARFITGEASLSQFDEYRQIMLDAGVEELEDIYNAAEARIRAQG